MEPGGIEPTPDAASPPKNADSEHERATWRATDPHLALVQVVLAWPQLDEHERAAVLAIVRARPQALAGSRVDERLPADRPLIPDVRSFARTGVPSTRGRDEGAEHQKTLARPIGPRGLGVSPRTEQS